MHWIHDLIRDKDWDNTKLGCLIDTPKRLNCWCCSHTRSREGRTIQELRHGWGKRV